MSRSGSGRGLPLAFAILCLVGVIGVHAGPAGSPRKDGTAPACKFKRPVEGEAIAGVSVRVLIEATDDDDDQVGAFP